MYCTYNEPLVNKDPIEHRFSCSDKTMFSTSGGLYFPKFAIASSLTIEALLTILKDEAIRLKQRFARNSEFLHGGQVRAREGCIYPKDATINLSERKLSSYSALKPSGHCAMLQFSDAFLSRRTLSNIPSFGSPPRAGRYHLYYPAGRGPRHRDPS